MAGKPVIKSVAFNPSDPDQKAMLEHAGLRSSFSGYIKRLIQRDMEGGYPKSQATVKEKTPEFEGLMKGLI